MNFFSEQIDTPLDVPLGTHPDAPSIDAQSILETQIAKATDRLDFDIADRLQELQNKTPADLAPAPERKSRERFLIQSLGDEHQAINTLERVLAGNELQPISYLARGAIAARSVARILIRKPDGRPYGWGTGFLIAPQVLITNNHVLPDSPWASQSEAQFNYEIDLQDQPIVPTIFGLDPKRLFFTSKALDFTLVAVNPTSTLQTNSPERPLGDFGWLPLLETPGKSLEGEWLTIIQHPAGQRKQICVRENRLLKRAEDVLWYSTDTLGGSSGSPVYNNDWFVVALHHSGIPEKKNGRLQSIDGQDFDPKTMDETQIKWAANEGIRASRIVATLQKELPQHPLLQPLFNATPESARVLALPTAANANQAPSQAPGSTLSPSPTPTPAAFPPMTASSDATSATPAPIVLPTITIPLQINLQIQVPIANTTGVSPTLVPSNISLTTAPLTTADNRPEIATSPSSSVAPNKPRPSKVEVPFNPDYSTRKGYAPDFLGSKNRVGFPQLSPEILAEATRLLANSAQAKPTSSKASSKASAKASTSLKPGLKPGATPGASKGNDNYLLHYTNYSLVMHQKRRFAIYSAANISFANRYAMGRPADTWRMDPRIPTSAQVGADYYANNLFDRGHLTRREDLEYGPTAAAALSSAGDTNHFTNCTPQHSGFNQSKAIWQGIERHILEEAIVAGNFNAQVFTGPIFGPEDPLYRDLPYPLKYWKVVAALNTAGKLFATAYLASQAQVIADKGLEVDPMDLLGPYQLFQVKVTEIERLTGLHFVCGPKDDKPLSAHDPLEKPGVATAKLSPTESAFLESGPADYVPLADLDSIVL